MPRAIASLSLSFGLVSIPVKLFSATEASSAVRFKLMRVDGARVRQQYVSDAPTDQRPEPVAATPSSSKRSSRRQDPPPLAQSSNVRELRAAEMLPPQRALEIEEPALSVVERDDIVKGYEFEKGKFVLFTPDELKALQEASRQTIDIVSFVPQETIDPVYYDKAYLLAPEKGGSKPYSLLHEALRSSGRCALAKWAWRSKQYVVQVRAVDGGLVLQQLRYAEEVRSVRDLKIDLAPVTAPELQLALQLIEHISEEAFDPTQFVDEEKQRILAAVEKKIAGQEIVAPQHVETSRAEVVDLMAALRASLSEADKAKSERRISSQTTPSAGQRKPPVRATKSVEGLAQKRAGVKKKA
jgi:DNA end-binding protein Ku